MRMAINYPHLSPPVCFFDFENFMTLDYILPFTMIEVENTSLSLWFRTEKD